MLFGAADTASDVEVAAEFLTGHTDVAFKRYVLECLCNGTGRTDCSTGCLGQVLDELHVLLVTDTLTGGNNSFSLGNRCVGCDTDGKVIAVTLKGGNEFVDLILCTTLAEDAALANTGNRRGLFGDGAGAACACGLADLAEQVCRNNDSLDFVGAFVDRGNLGIAVGSLDVHTFDEARSAKDLQGIVTNFKSDVGSVHLGHSGFATVALVIFF